jgi:hypothetical protein
MEMVMERQFFQQFIGRYFMKTSFTFLLFSVLLSLSWASKASYASDASACASVSHLITLKNVKKTFDTYEKISIVDKLKKLNEAQVEAWIEPIPYKYEFEGASSHRVVAILKATDKYCLLLLMRCEGIPHREEVEMSEWLYQENVINQQYIVSVDKQGKYIDALPVAYTRNLSNWDIEFDADRDVYIFSTLFSSHFEGDQIRVVQASSVKDAPIDPSGKYRKELHEIIYSVNKDGKIIETVPRRQIKEKSGQ